VGPSIWPLAGPAVYADRVRQRRKEVRLNVRTIGAASLLFCGLAAVASVSGQTPRLTIGRLQGSNQEIFGVIQAIVADADGNLYVLDKQSLEIRTFSQSGSFLGSAGRRGSGPGEFRVPVSMSIDESNRLYVLDNYFERATVFARQTARLNPIGTIKLPHNPQALCAFRDKLYVVAPTEKAIIHEFRNSGDSIRSFGEPQRVIDDKRLSSVSVRASLLEQQNAGHITCTNNGLIVFAHRSLPYVVAFRSDGRLAWRSTLSDFNRVRWVTGSSAQSLTQTPAPGKSTVHQTVSVITVDDSTVGVVISERSLRGQVGDFHVRLLSSANGRERNRATSPVLIAGSTNYGFFGYVNTPFPTVTVFSTLPFNPTRKR
jgi:hypothetical protein